jgi:amidase
VIAYLDLSATFTSTDLVNAQRIRRRFKESVDQIFSTHDLFLSPAQIVLPPRVDDVDVVFEDGRRAPRDLSLIRTLAPFNLSGHPALSLPVAVDGSTGHTVSLQLVAEHDRDWWLLGIGALLEDAVGAMPAPVAP